MNHSTITAHVKMSSKLLRSFALYDTFHLKKKWKAPALFCAILLVFAEVCFLLPSKEQSSMIGTVLALIGVGLPLAYVLHFLVQVQDQIRRLGLKAPRPAYTINLAPDSLRVINDMREEPELRLAYDSLYGVYRSSAAYYLYATSTRAFILPDGQYPLSPAQLWDVLKARLPEGKLHGKKP